MSFYWTLPCITFEQVPHVRLLHKLDHYRVRGDNYSSAIENHKSSLSQVRNSRGTIRRSTRDSTRFAVVLAFINDLPGVIKSSKLFADDSAVFKVIEKDHDRQLLQEDITALEKWD